MSKFIRSSLVYVLLNGISSVIPFLLIPFYTSYLTPTDFGFFTSFQILSGFISPFISFGFLSYIERAQSSTDTITKKNSVLISVVTFFLNSGIIFLLFIPFRLIFVSLVPLNWLIITSIIIIPLSQNIAQIILTIYQMNNRPNAYFIYSILNIFLTTIFSVFFVYFINSTWQGRVTGMFISSAILIFVSLVILYKYLFSDKIVFSSLEIKQMFKYGAPLVLNNIFGYALLIVDRMFLFTKIGPEETGLYSLGFQISQIIVLVLLAINTAFIPWLYNQLKSEDVDKKIKIVRWSYLFIFSSVFLSMIFGFLSPFLLTFFVNKSFDGAFKFVFLLSLAQGVRSIYFATSNYITYSGKTKYILYSMIISFCIHVPISYLLIHKYSAIGAAYAVLFSNFFSSSIVFFFSSKAYPMPWFNIKYFKNEL